MRNRSLKCRGFASLVMTYAATSIIICAWMVDHRDGNFKLPVKGKVSISRHILDPDLDIKSISQYVALLVARTQHSGMMLGRRLVWSLGGLFRRKAFDAKLFCASNRRRYLTAGGTRLSRPKPQSLIGKEWLLTNYSSNWW